MLRLEILLPVLSIAVVSLAAVFLSFLLWKRLVEVRRYDRLVDTARAQKSQLERYVDALLLFDKTGESADIPEELRELARYGSSQQHLLVSYMLWATGDVKRGIEVAEVGLRIAEEEKAPTDRILRFKNSLAYYYAEARLSSKEHLARQYAEEAHRGRPEDAAVKDTLGYVKIVFGKSKKEVLEGLEMCDAATRAGNMRRLFNRYLSVASERLNELPP